MKKIKVPHHSFLLTDTCPLKDAQQIKEFANKLEYDLSIDECKDLWVILRETTYSGENVDISLESVQKAIIYVVRGVIWSNPTL